MTTNEPKPTLATPAELPKLTQLADACNDGACNVSGLVISFGEAIRELPLGQPSRHPAVKMILGQLTWLCHESTGPSTEAYEAYQEWRKQ